MRKGVLLWTGLAALPSVFVHPEAAVSVSRGDDQRPGSGMPLVVELEPGCA
jgi:hypothetical protein